MGFSLKCLGNYIDSPDSFARHAVDLFQHLTMIRTDNENCTPDEKLGVARFGWAFYDVDGSAHERYGIPEHEGRILTLRPDCTVGTACRLEHVTWMSNYFLRFLKIKQVGRDDVKDAEMTPTLEGMADVDIHDV